MPDPRCDGHMHALHFNAAAILHVVPADVVLESIRPREVIVVFVLVPPHDAAGAIHPTAHRLAPNRDAHVSKHGPVGNREGETVVCPITVFLREHVGPAGRVGRSADNPASGAPRPGPAEREAGGWLPDARAVECPAGGGLRGARRGIQYCGRGPDQGEAKRDENREPGVCRSHGPSSLSDLHRLPPGVRAARPGAGRRPRSGCNSGGGSRRSYGCALRSP